MLIKGAGAKCSHIKLEVRTRVRTHLNLDVQGACVRATPKKPSQLTLCHLYVIHRKRKKLGRQVKDFR